MLSLLPLSEAIFQYHSANPLTRGHSLEGRMSVNICSTFPTDTLRSCVGARHWSLDYGSQPLKTHFDVTQRPRPYSYDNHLDNAIDLITSAVVIFDRDFVTVAERYCYDSTNYVLQRF